MRYIDRCLVSMCCRVGAVGETTKDVKILYGLWARLCGEHVV